MDPHRPVSQLFLAALSGRSSRQQRLEAGVASMRQRSCVVIVVAVCCSISLVAVAALGSAWRRQAELGRAAALGGDEAVAATAALQSAAKARKS